MTPAHEPSHRHPGVTWAAIRAELVREAGQRARVYPRRIERGDMTQAHADRERNLIAAMIADVDRAAGDAAVPAAPDGFTWRDRREALHRELDLRARLYPRWIAEGRLDQAQADRQTAPLACLLHLYDCGMGWIGPDAHPARERAFARDFAGTRAWRDFPAIRGFIHPAVYAAAAAARNLRGLEGVDRDWLNARVAVEANDEALANEIDTVINDRRKALRAEGQVK